MSTRNFLGGLVAGTLLGAALVAMMAPRTRDELMGDAADQMRRIVPFGRKVMEEMVRDRMR